MQQRLQAGWWWFIPVMEEKGRPAEEQSQAEAPIKITAAEMRLHLLTADLPEDDDVVSIVSPARGSVDLPDHPRHHHRVADFYTEVEFQPAGHCSRSSKSRKPLLSRCRMTLLKVKPPKTNITSDKNRIAQTKTPTVDKETLRKLIDARKAGPPKASPPPPPGQQAQQQNPATAQTTAPVPAVQPTPPATAQLESPAPAAPKKSPFTIASPGASVNDAIHSAAAGHGNAPVAFGGGEYGSGVKPNVAAKGGLEILSDTMGVDFGPYMKRLRYTVQTHWDPLIPESAMPPVMKKGVVIIEFAITKEGKVMGMKLVGYFRRRCAGPCRMGRNH